MEDLSAKVEEQAKELARLQSELGVMHGSCLGRRRACLPACAVAVKSTAASSWQTNPALMLTSVCVCLGVAVALCAR